MVEKIWKEYNPTYICVAATSFIFVCGLWPATSKVGVDARLDLLMIIAVGTLLFYGVLIFATAKKYKMVGTKYEEVNKPTKEVTTYTEWKKRGE